jgi:3-mercaptopyruvate sulfurtransferase SseA
VANAYYLDGGFEAWRAAGYPLERKGKRLGFF